LCDFDFREVHEMIDDAVQPGAFRNVNGSCAAQVVTVTIDAVQSDDLLRTTGLSAGDAFAELGDLLLDGLNRPDSRIDTRSCRCGQLSNES
jgi:hypothetical protein